MQYIIANLPIQLSKIARYILQYNHGKVHYLLRKISKVSNANILWYWPRIAVTQNVWIKRSWKSRKWGLKLIEKTLLSAQKKTMEANDTTILLFFLFRRNNSPVIEITRLHLSKQMIPTCILHRGNPPMRNFPFTRLKLNYQIQFTNYHPFGLHFGKNWLPIESVLLAIKQQNFETFP